MSTTPDDVSEMKANFGQIFEQFPLGFFNSAIALQDGRKSAAIEALYVLAVENGVGEASVNLGAFLWDQGRLEAAIETLLRSYGLGHTQAALFLGQIYEEMGELDLAVEWYERAPEDPATPLRLARTLRKRGDAAEAEDVLRRGAVWSAEAAVELIRWVEMTTAEKIDLLETYLASGEVDVLLPLAQLYEDAGRPDEAVRALRTSVSLGERNSLTNLAVLLWYRRDKGDRTEALTLWTEAARRGDKLAVRALKARVGRASKKSKSSKKKKSKS